MPDDLSFCTMHVGDQLFGVDVLQVHEIIGEQRITPVPLAPAAALGVLNLRGEIVPVVCLGRTLGANDACAGLVGASGRGRRNHVVVRNAAGLTSLAVDGVGDVLAVDPANTEAPPETLRGAAREIIKAVHKLNGRLLLELDVDAVLAAATV